MEIKIQKIENVTIISIFTQVLGGDDSEQIHDTLNDVLLYINSIGVGILMSSWTHIMNAEGNMVILCTSKKVLETLSVCETDQIIPIYSNIADAMSKLKESS
jgi:anti-anti-sigma factor